MSEQPAKTLSEIMREREATLRTVPDVASANLFAMAATRLDALEAETARLRGLCERAATQFLHGVAAEYPRSGAREWLADYAALHPTEMQRTPTGGGKR